MLSVTSTMDGIIASSTAYKATFTLTEESLKPLIKAIEKTSDFNIIRDLLPLLVAVAVVILAGYIDRVLQKASIRKKAKYDIYRDFVKQFTKIQETAASFMVLCGKAPSTSIRDDCQNPSPVTEEWKNYSQELFIKFLELKNEIGSFATIIDVWVVVIYRIHGEFLIFNRATHKKYQHIYSIVSNVSYLEQLPLNIGEPEVKAWLKEVDKLLGRILEDYARFMQKLQAELARDFFG